MTINIANIFAEHQVVIEKLNTFILPLQHAAEKIVTRLKKGGTLFWMGNGGSAADAQHMAAELIGRFYHERPAIAAIALTTDSSVLTCLSNDYHFATIFARQLEGLCKTNDVVIGLSTSGNSENIVRGMHMAQQRGALTIAFTGAEGGKLKNIVDYCFGIPSRNTPRIQEATTLLCHTLCEIIENKLVT